METHKEMSKIEEETLDNDIGEIIPQLDGPAEEIQEVTPDKEVFFFFGQRCGASQWRVCYQRGLPRLYLTDPV